MYQAVFILSVAHIFAHLICITTPWGRYKACNMTKSHSEIPESEHMKSICNLTLLSKVGPQQKSAAHAKRSLVVLGNGLALWF